MRQVTQRPILIIAALVVACLASAHCSAEKYGFRFDYGSVSMKMIGESGSYDLIATKKDGSESTLVRIGMSVLHKPDSVEQPSEGEYVLRFPEEVELRFSAEQIYGGGLKIRLNWTAPIAKRLQDCVRLRSGHWYGGPQQKYQYWPVDKLQLKEYSYVTKEADNCGVAEPYWLSSEGTYIYADSRVPLFVDQNQAEASSLCLIADVKQPYSRRSRKRNLLAYTLVLMDDPRQAHQHAIAHHLGHPTGVPDYRMIEHPIWSTWALFKRDVNESAVMSLARDILDNRFDNSQFEIDDSWETCYGSLTVEQTRFPDFKALNLKLKKMGFRVTVWVHPFINKGCEPYYSEALSKKYLVMSESGDVETDWWNNNHTRAAYVDFTKREARDWWVGRLRRAQELYAIDSFKFDAGESSWSPQVPVQVGDAEEHPSHITKDYVTAVSEFGAMVEVRAAQRTQTLPIFVRMIDKDTYWTFQNGLPTLVTTLLQMNMNGYGFVLPDMVGGNGYNEPPSKELFVRWLQANVFMPSIQYSYVPWLYDRETVEICLKFSRLHAQFAGEVAAAFRRAAESGAPVNAPVWWAAPGDAEAHAVWDEFLLGEDLLAAPVLRPAAVARDVYLPPGVWLAEGDPRRVFQGGRWHRDYPAPLDVLPYFIRRK